MLIFIICFCLGALLGSCAGGTDREEKAKTKASAVELRATTAKITYIEGKVRVKRSGSSEWQPANLEMKLSARDKLRTAVDSFANIEFESGGVLRVGPESLVVVTDLKTEQETQLRRYTFTLMRGEVEAELKALRQTGSEFKIRTPSTEASVLHREVAFQ